MYGTIVVPLDPRCGTCPARPGRTHALLCLTTQALRPLGRVLFDSVAREVVSSRSRP